ncbi:NAD(P)/FAD-dependent oxidoreductase [Lentzea sp. BCCO 10_0061]|uniref:NAD(P)/FAD-dependent oxidoreductase n=1 Tax=Lentzea sokolovensis TaxID=3095429 RepID=A0ABU4UR93_9PSEU|nr:NAD(P)/FAD-dependent oxidoreductase [Lentzea sp. BCCO 10_0061]MDX8142016.1 NAD(P)/FAD-dependent oxidoreductase [Lentzea sp. BCCO 10_0061]
MTANPEVVVIGAGFGGLGVALSLRRAGFDRFTVLERANEVGGVWRDNTYPGAACDVPSSLYSYSFAPSTSWPRRYAAQPDILRYLRDTASAVRDRIRFGAEVVAATFDESRHRWSVALAAGDVVEADVLVCATGQLSRPSIPALPGLGRFAGEVFHSARWRHDVDLRGRRVAVVGTGASAAQFVPEIAPLAGHLTVFQRSAPHVLPKPDARLSGRSHPTRLRVARAGVWLGGELLTGLLNAGRLSRRAVAAVAATHRRIQVRDPALRAALRPDTQPGCKRVLFSNDWYPALTRRNVGVVAEPITEVTEHGLRTADGREHPADVLIWGTGFAVSGFGTPARITGRNGRSLAEAWGGRPRAHLGLTVPGFPSLFLIYGPNTNLGGNSVITMIEAQCRYVVSAVRHLAETGAATLEVRRDVAAAFDEEMTARLTKSVWSTCSSWYRTTDGTITTNWPGGTLEYLRRTARLRTSDHEPARTTAEV